MLHTSELRIMALRQQQQIDTQQQLLAAREQRLRFLKAQEACETAAVAEGERLRRLRERVEAQESKLRRLRALRGQVDLQKTYNVTLGNDLDSIRALFSEKEKELTLAVAKVEALTRQLEELRRDRRGTLNLFPGLSTHSQFNNSPSTAELEKLRGELMYRNQLSLQQDARLHLQREALQKRQAELQSVDQRILELQERLNRKRALNIVPHKQSSSQTVHAHNLSINHVRSVSSNFCSQQKTPKNNVVAVEPFNRLPQKTIALGSNGNKINISNNVNNNTSQSQMGHDFPHIKTRHNHQQSLSGCVDNLSDSVFKDNNMNAESDESKLAALQKKLEHVLKNNENYQSDPHLENQTIDSSNNIVLKEQQFTKNQEMINNDNENYNEPNSRNCYYNAQKDDINIDINVNNKIGDALENPDSCTNECDSDKVSDLNGVSSRTQMAVTVHSTPLTLSNKSVAVPVTSSTTATNDQQNKILNPYGRTFAYNVLQNIPSGNLVVPPRKPNISSGSKSLSTDIKVNLVTPQSQSKTIPASMEYAEATKPALPPKPNKFNNHILETEVANKLAEGNETSQTNVHVACKSSNVNISDNQPIKARPLTIKKSPQCEQPKLRHSSNNGWVYKTQHPVQRFIESPMMVVPTEMGISDENTTNEMSQNVLRTDNEKSESTRQGNSKQQIQIAVDAIKKSNESQTEQTLDKRTDEITRRKRFISTVINDGKNKLARRVSFDPLALLLDASLEGELELVQKTALQVSNPSAANDEGITALHNAICAGHVEIVEFLVSFGCDVNAQDSDGWTPLHCAASCNNLSMVKFLVESGACLFAATLSDQETPAEKCEEDEEGFDGCSEYLYSIQEKLGILNHGEVYAVFSYDAQHSDELSFCVNDKLTIIRKGDETEREWWWARDEKGKEGYIPRNLLGFYPRVLPFSDIQIE
ncbi:apoptosis-stimulating of p53 protein 1 [Toxorhynchites rutilus septentrionalis]|uniref:apoptosis-stimulating of p53 protein 1 n=1 Tax=Toxorhynchites rutilus septentrionalis TaxID=329112 RepID=UPI002479324E|nr:apoptosis-stimulating of p53 protein 1 [Toxorhynchites rutilus septentrionalis]